MHVLALLLALVPTVSAYPPEVPLFEQTEFRDEYGMFRWYQGCWFRVRHQYAYIICSPDGQPIERVPLSDIPELIEAGLLPADSSTGLFIDQYFSESRNRSLRWSEGRITAAPGDGTSLSGSSGFRFSLPPYSGGGFGNLGGFDSLGSGIFQFDGVGNFNGLNFTGGIGGGFDGLNFSGGSTISDGFNGVNFSGGSSSDGGFDGFSNVNRFAPRENDGSTFRFSSRDGNGGSGLSGGGDGTAGGNGEGPLGRPLGFGCDSIDDSRDGGPLGPVPCTSYPGVFGPVPQY